MFVVYKAELPGNPKFYIGYTSNLNNRVRTHRFYCFSGKKNKFYSFARKHGFENLVFSVLRSFDNKEEALAYESYCIDLTNPNCLNLATGGEGGYVVPDCKKEEWKESLSKARQGRKPSLGMKHSEANKKSFGAYGKLRWDLYGRYPDGITNLSFKEASATYGISRTHYYRLKRAKGSDLG